MPIGFILILNIGLFIWYKIAVDVETLKEAEKVGYNLFFLLLALSSVVMIAFLVVIFFQFKNTTILIGDKGIAFVSLLRKIRAKWHEVEDIMIIERKNGSSLSVKTENGTFVISPQYVEKGQPVPEMKVKNRKLLVKDGDSFIPLELEKTEIFKTMQKFVPDSVKIIKKTIRKK